MSGLPPFRRFRSVTYKNMLPRSNFLQRRNPISFCAPCLRGERSFAQNLVLLKSHTHSMLVSQDFGVWTKSHLILYADFKDKQLIFVPKRI